MAIRKLLTLDRHLLPLLTPPDLPAPPWPLSPLRRNSLMHYDVLARAVSAKIKHFEDSDPRFLRYASPHPTLVDHISILFVLETCITTLPNSLRVAIKLTLASCTAIFGIRIDVDSCFETKET